MTEIDVRLQPKRDQAGPANVAMATVVAMSLIVSPMMNPAPAVAVSYQERMEEKAARKQALLDSYDPTCIPDHSASEVYIASECLCIRRQHGTLSMPGGQCMCRSASILASGLAACCQTRLLQQSSRDVPPVVQILRARAAH
jgi:hypothetical protein